MNDLDQLLRAASDAIASSTAPIDEHALDRVRGTVRRARIRRHVATSAGGVACVGVLGAVTAYGLGHDDAPPPPARTAEPSVAPTASPTPSPTPTPTQTPTSTPTASSTPAGPVERAAEIDDATVVARLAAPRTGEMWHEPVRDDAALAELLAPEDSWSVYRVGARGDATVYLAVHDTTVSGMQPRYLDAGALLLETDRDGARAVLCPSARVGDPCADPGTVLAEGVSLDEDTFYDSLTLPAELDAGPGWVFRTASTRELPYTAAYGLPLRFGVEGNARTVVDLGPLALVETNAQSGGPAGLSSHEYAVRLPFGTFVVLEPADQPNASYDSITWDDGVLRADSISPFGGAPGAYTCESLQFSTEPAHVPADWREAGTTASGLRVVVPREGGNAVSDAVRAYQDEESWAADGSRAYGYPTDEAFLDAHALWGVQGPDDTWQLRIRKDAESAVYECS